MFRIDVCFDSRFVTFMSRIPVLYSYDVIPPKLNKIEICIAKIYFEISHLSTIQIRYHRQYVARTGFQIVSIIKNEKQQTDRDTENGKTDHF